MYLIMVARSSVARTRLPLYFAESLFYFFFSLFYLYFKATLIALIRAWYVLFGVILLSYKCCFHFQWINDDDDDDDDDDEIENTGLTEWQKMHSCVFSTALNKVVVANTIRFSYYFIQYKFVQPEEDTGLYPANVAE